MIWIEGELSNLARPASGHWYFSLKDASAQVRCAMFRPRTSALRFKPENGMQVLLRARASVYEPRGEFQLIVEHLEEAGAGALARAFEQCKARLAAEGLFDESRKKSLPRFARRIGVLTSPSGAVIRDIINVLSRRFPLLEVDLLPVPVQGTGAAAEIREQLSIADASHRYDVLILARGGGSAEDLAPFNDEILARTIAACTTPVVSAVGHETDFSITDFVADLRAPTPSAAAELVTPDQSVLYSRLLTYQQSLTRWVRRQLQSTAQHLDYLQARLQARHPQAQLNVDREHLRVLQRQLQQILAKQQRERAHRLSQALLRLQGLDPYRQLNFRKQALEALHRRLQRAWRQRIERAHSALTQSFRTLQALGPLATLERGYAILLDAQGHVIRSVATLEPGQKLQAQLADGRVKLEIIE